MRHHTQPLGPVCESLWLSGPNTHSEPCDVLHNISGGPLKHARHNVLYGLWD